MRSCKTDTATLYRTTAVLDIRLFITDSPPVSTPVAARRSQETSANANNNAAAAAGSESTIAAAAAQRYGYDALQTPQQQQGDVSYTYSATPHSEQLTLCTASLNLASCDAQLMSYDSKRLAALLSDAERDDAAPHMRLTSEVCAQLVPLYTKLSDNATKRSTSWNKSVDHIAHRLQAKHRSILVIAVARGSSCCCCSIGTCVGHDAHQSSIQVQQLAVL
eukprot:16738-Heterococcus_DN1.PRE.5